MFAHRRHRPARFARPAAPLSVLVASLLAAALVAACGGSGGQSGHGHSHSGSSGRTHHGPTATQPIASQNIVQDVAGQPNSFRISVYDLRRDGPFLVLDFSSTCTAANASGSSCTELLGPGGTLGPVTGGTTHSDNLDASGVSLVDPVNDMAYYAVRDSSLAAYTSRLTLAPSPGQTVYDWVRFPAPPATVTRLDVTFPSSDAVFSSVPITSQASGPIPVKGATVDPAGTFAQPPTSTNTTGLTLPVGRLQLTTGTAAGYDLNRGNSRVVTLPSDVLFAFDKATLTSRAQAIIAAAAGQIKTQATGPVQIAGYTDSIGPDSVNLPLSIHRAQAVARALATLAPNIRFTATGYGDADPVAPNTLPSGADDPAGRQLNRRVTISYPVKPPAPKPTPAPPSVTPTSGSAPTFTDDPAKNGEQYQDTVESFTREGDLLLLRLSIQCSRQGPNSSSCDQGTDMSAASTLPPVPMENDTADDAHLNGFMVEDTTNGREGISPRDAYGNAMTSTLDLQNVGQTFTAWIYFADPSPSASTLTLVAPQGTARISIPVPAG